MHEHVVNQVVDHDLCIGCGVCVGVCPSKLLTMAWRQNGDLGVAIDGDCPPSCNLCLKVCPFYSGNPNEDDLAKGRLKTAELTHDGVIGFISKASVGYTTNTTQRLRSASGGIITSVLRELLDTRMVDSVICVGPGDQEDRLFEFQEITDSAELDKCASSKYYPVDVATVISRLQTKSSNRKVAITGLPCTLKGIALAAQTLPRIRKQIIFMIGLVCGRLPNKFYTEYLTTLSIGDRSALNVDYRSKYKTNTASNFSFIARSNARQVGKRLPFDSVVSTAYSNDMFQHNSCNFCDDVFAEIADLTVMDAWLPEYTLDNRGHSIVISRSTILDNLLEKMRHAGQLEMSDISIDSVKKSQLGVIDKKRQQLQYRLSRSVERGDIIPTKRVQPLPVSLIKRMHLWAAENVQNESKRIWAIDPNPEAILNAPKIRLCLAILKVNNSLVRLRNVMRDPQRLRHYIKRKIFARLT